MTTALDIITDALIEINAHDLGQTVPSEDAQLGLRRLNQLMGRWSQQRLLAPALTQVDITTTGAASYAVGPSTSKPRLLTVQRATATYLGVEHQVDVLNRAQWDAISVKGTTGGPPSAVWYEPTLTDGTIHVYPKANLYTLSLKGLALITSFPLLTTSLTLPEGYESAIVLTLACDLCGPFQKQIPPDLQRRSAGAVRAIKRTNAEPIVLSVDLAADDEYQIERGY